MSLDDFAEWDAALAQAKLGVGPAELHGSVTGFLCAGRPGRAHELLAALTLESEVDNSGGSGALHALLERAAGEISARLRAGEQLDPLLPKGTLAARADAVVDWCRGFLGGLGLTGVLEERAGVPAVHELLHDFGQVAAAHLVCDDDDEAALDDVLDFIRGGVVHLHAAFVPAGRP